MKPFTISSAHLISPGFEQEGASLQIIDGEIRTIGKGTSGGDFDAGGHYVVPGFIDIHTHGAGGASAMDGTEEAMRVFAERKVQEGVTTFLPTTWTASEEDLVTALQGVAAYQKRPDFARVPAVHIEGPFINPNCVGAQNPAEVRLPDMAEMDRLGKVAKIALISLAVEMEGGMKFVAEAKQRGIVTSAAHSAATYAEFCEAKAAGLAHLTHFCNQMTKLHHREIGLVGAGLLDDEIRLEMICDLIHLCPEMIELTFKHKPLEQILLITDSISASWQPDGDYEDGGQRVLVKDGICRLENGSLAGSTLRFDRGFKHVADITGKPLPELIRTTSWNQALSLGLEKVGKIEPGFFADLVVLDRETLEPRATFVGGELRFQTD